MSVHDLDEIQRIGKTLSLAVEALDRTHLRALADRYDLSSFATEKAMRVSVKRRLVDATGQMPK